MQFVTLQVLKDYHSVEGFTLSLYISTQSNLVQDLVSIAGLLAVLVIAGSFLDENLLVVFH